MRQWDTKAVQEQISGPQLTYESVIMFVIVLLGRTRYLQPLALAVMEDLD